MFDKFANRVRMWHARSGMISLKGLEIRISMQQQQQHNLMNSVRSWNTSISHYLFTHFIQDLCRTIMVCLFTWQLKRKFSAPDTWPIIVANRTQHSNGHHKIEISFFNVDIGVWAKCHHRGCAHCAHLYLMHTHRPEQTMPMCDAHWLYAFCNLIKTILPYKTGSELNVIGHWKIESLEEPTI